VSGEELLTVRGLGWPAWRYAGRRALHGFVRHRGLDSAAALTFYAALALFPASLVLVSGFALANGDRDTAVRRITDIASEFALPSTVDAMRGPLRAFIEIPNPGLALTIGIVALAWAVGSYSTAFGRAINSIYEVQEGRQFWKFRPLMTVVALVLMVCFAIVVVMLLTTPVVAGAVAEHFGVGGPWVALWNVGKWPVLVALAIAMVGILYYYTPNVRHARIRWVSWGAMFAIVVWALATIAFAAYVLTFETYNRVYGWLGGAIALLVYLYITDLVLVLGAEVDAELVRVRQLAAGIAAETSIRLPLRDSARNLMLARQLSEDEREGRVIRESASRRGD
jgi:membrane protein